MHQVILTNSKTFINEIARMMPRFITAAKTYEGLLQREAADIAVDAFEFLKAQVEAGNYEGSPLWEDLWDLAEIIPLFSPRTAVKAYKDSVIAHRRRCMPEAIRQDPDAFLAAMDARRSQFLFAALQCKAEIALKTCCDMDAEDIVSGTLELIVSQVRKGTFSGGPTWAAYSIEEILAEFNPLVAVRNYKNWLISDIAKYRRDTKQPKMVEFVAIDAENEDGYHMDRISLKVFEFNQVAAGSQNAEFFDIIRTETGMVALVHYLVGVKKGIIPTEDDAEILYPDESQRLRFLTLLQGSLNDKLSGLIPSATVRGRRRTAKPVLFPWLDDTQTGSAA